MGVGGLGPEPSMNHRPGGCPAVHERACAGPVAHPRMSNFLMLDIAPDLGHVQKPQCPGSDMAQPAGSLIHIHTVVDLSLKWLMPSRPR